MHHNKRCCTSNNKDITQDGEASRCKLLPSRVCVCVCMRRWRHRCPPRSSAPARAHIPTCVAPGGEISTHIKSSSFYILFSLSSVFRLPAGIKLLRKTKTSTTSNLTPARSCRHQTSASANQNHRQGRAETKRFRAPARPLGCVFSFHLFFFPRCTRACTMCPRVSE